MHPNLATRSKPELPKQLDLFRVLYNQLDHIPIGPEYVGNFEFAECRLSSDAIQFIKDNRNDFTVTQMTMQIASQYGQFARAEAIAFYYYKGNENKLWQVKITDYISAFEKRNNVIRRGGKHKNKQLLTMAPNFYKPFVVWCIENGYEYFQVSRVLGYAPGTVRRWANEWGYKEYTMVRSKQPDLTGKVNRVERSSEQGDLFSEQERDEWIDRGIAEAIANEVAHIPERHEMKLPREVKDKHDNDHKELGCPGFKAGYEEWLRDCYGRTVFEALKAGHKVSITIEPIQNVKAN